MLNLESNKLKFLFNGQEKEMKFPTVKEWGEYNKKIKAKEVDEGEMLMEFFVNMGLDRETCEQLESAHVESIVKALTEKKS